MSSNGSNKNANYWEKNFTELFDFHEEFGHCNVREARRMTTKHAELAKWVSFQRLRKSKPNRYSPLTNEQLELLNSIHFIWKLDKNEKDWEDNFQKIRRGISPQHDSELQKWISRQRELHQKNNLRKDRVVRLQEIGFQFCSAGVTTARRTNRKSVAGRPNQNSIADISFGNESNSAPPTDFYKWLSMHTLLKKFHSVHGHSHVTIKDDPALYQWTDQQRKFRDLLESNQLKMLNDIGFRWELMQDPSNDSSANMTRDGSANTRKSSKKAAATVKNAASAKNINNNNEIQDEKQDSDDDDDDNLEENSSDLTDNSTIDTGDEMEAPEYDLGAKLRKHCEEKGWLMGEIISWDGKFYRVRYEDGDDEQVSAEEMDDVVLNPNVSKVRVGTRVAVYWQGDECFYPATVKKRRYGHTEGFYLRYDDEIEEWVDLRSWTFHFVTNEPGASSPVVVTEASKIKPAKAPKKRRITTNKSKEELSAAEILAGLSDDVNSDDMRSTNDNDEQISSRGDNRKPTLELYDDLESFHMTKRRKKMPPTRSLNKESDAAAKSVRHKIQSAMLKEAVVKKRGRSSRRVASRSSSIGESSRTPAEGTPVLDKESRIASRRKPFTTAFKSAAKPAFRRKQKEEDSGSEHTPKMANDGNGINGSSQSARRPLQLDKTSPLNPGKKEDLEKKETKSKSEEVAKKASPKCEESLDSKENPTKKRLKKKPSKATLGRGEKSEAKDEEVKGTRSRRALIFDETEGTRTTRSRSDTSLEAAATAEDSPKTRKRPERNHQREKQNGNEQEEVKTPSKEPIKSVETKEDSRRRRESQKEGPEFQKKIDDVETRSSRTRRGSKSKIDETAEKIAKENNKIARRASPKNENYPGDKNSEDILAHSRSSRSRRGSGNIESAVVLARRTVQQEAEDTGNKEKGVSEENLRSTESKPKVRRSSRGHVSATELEQAIREADISPKTTRLGKTESNDAQAAKSKTRRRIVDDDDDEKEVSKILSDKPTKSTRRAKRTEESDEVVESPRTTRSSKSELNQVISMKAKKRRKISDHGDEGSVSEVQNPGKSSKTTKSSEVIKTAKKKRNSLSLEGTADNLALNPSLEEVIVGTKVAIFWPLERRSFEGIVTKKRLGKFYIAYDDGDTEWVTLAEERFRIKRQPEPASGSESKHPATSKPQSLSKKEAKSAPTATPEKTPKKLNRVPKKVDSTLSIEEKPQKKEKAARSGRSDLRSRDNRDTVPRLDKNVGKMNSSKRSLHDDKKSHNESGDTKATTGPGVGSRVAIFWENDRQYYEGVISKERTGRKRNFFVEYDDGDTEWVNLAFEKFYLVDGTSKTAKPRLKTNKQKKQKRERPPSSSDDESIVNVGNELPAIKPNWFSKNTKKEPPKVVEHKTETTGNDNKRGNSGETEIEIGTRVAGSWPGDKEFYKGVITRKNKGKGRRFYVKYDDGDEDWVDFLNTEFYVIPSTTLPKENVGDTRKLTTGSRISIWWPDEREYFNATVKEISHMKSHPYYVLYDDGDKEWVDLSEKKFRLV